MHVPITGENSSFPHETKGNGKKSKRKEIDKTEKKLSNFPVVQFEK